jgi:uncharacterized GH25 family protein
VKRYWIYTCMILLLLLAMTGTLFAHEIYIEIDDEIEVGVPTEIRIVWGHFPDVPDPSSSYFAELPQGQLVIIEPDGTERLLTLTARDDYYVAVFTPGRAGDHWAVFRHHRGVLDWTHSEPQGSQLIEVSAKALLDVHGDDELVAFSRLAGHDLEILPLVDGGHIHAGEDYMAQLLYMGKPLSGATVLYYGPDAVTGEVMTGPGGTFTFPLTAEGDWLIKISFFDEARAGDADGITVMGARYSTTLLVTPHAHEDNDYTTAPPASAANGYTGYIALIILLLAGAGYLFMKSGKKAS